VIDFATNGIGIPSLADEASETPTIHDVKIRVRLRKICAIDRQWRAVKSPNSLRSNDMEDGSGDCQCTAT
jgi:hypothetical protein